MTDRELVTKAYEAQGNAYAPYSGFLVGAALLAKSGKIYTGCNVENAAYSPSNCAERTAFFKAVSEGEREFDAIAIVGNGKDAPKEAWEFCPPCGVCRQVMAEFVQPESFRILLGKGEEIREITLGELLPESFSGKNISRKNIS